MILIYIIIILFLLFLVYYISILVEIYVGKETVLKSLNQCFGFKVKFCLQ